MTDDGKKLFRSNVLFGLFVPLCLAFVLFLSFPLAVFFAPEGEGFFQQPFMLCMVGVAAVWMGYSYYKKGKILALSLIERVRLSVGFLITVIYVPIFFLTTTPAADYSERIYSIWVSYTSILIIFSLIAQYLGYRTVHFKK